MKIDYSLDLRLQIKKNLLKYKQAISVMALNSIMSFGLRYSKIDLK